MFKPRHIPNEIKKHKEWMIKTGVELAIPGHKLKFFVDYKIMTDKVYPEENKNGDRKAHV